MKQFTDDNKPELIVSENYGVCYTFGSFKISVNERLLFKDGVAVIMPPKLFDTLLVLIENRGHIISKDELMKLIWPDRYVSGINIAVNISTLRRILEDSKDSPAFIKTFPKRGYTFVQDVEVINCCDEPSQKNSIRSAIPENIEKEIPGQQKITQATLSDEGSSLFVKKPYLSRSAYLWAAVAITSFGIMLFLLLKNSAEPKHPVIEGKSIAVLPFQIVSNEQEDQEKAILSLAIADSVINRLSSLRGIDVRPTASILSFAEKQDYSSEALSRLSVDFILTGTIEPTPKLARVRVQIIDASQGNIVWAEEFTELFPDGRVLQSLIAQRLEKLISTNLLIKEESLSKPYVPNAQSYDNYVRGLYFWNKRGYPDLEKAVEYFQQSIEGDSNYALAHAMLADCYGLISRHLVDEAEVRATIEKSRKAANEAIKLDQRLAVAYIALAFTAESEAEKKELYERAFALDVNNPTVYERYSRRLIRQGLLDEGLMYMEKAHHLDPLSPAIGSTLARLYFYKKEYARALDLTNKVLEIYPDNVHARMTNALIFEQEKAYDLAIAEIQKILTIVPAEPTILGSLGHIYASVGRKSEAQILLRDISNNKKFGKFLLPGLMFVNLGLGNQEQALKHLKDGVRHNILPFDVIYFDPRLEVIRHQIPRPIM